MFRRIQKLLIATMVLALVLAITGTAFATSVAVKVNTATRVYKTASTSAASVVVKKGLQVTLTGVSGNWARVSYKGKTGYMPVAALDAVNRATGYVSKATRLYKTASTKSASMAMPVNTRVYVIGVSGSFYRVQNASGSVTGYLPKGTLSRTQVSTSKSASSSSWKAKVVKMDWFDGGSDVLKRGQYAYIYDIQTGVTIRIKRMGGINHADVEPATKADTAKLWALRKGWSWDSRPVILVANGKYIACAINTMPHGSQTITNNGYNGQFCLHMVNSLTHGTSKINENHQASIRTAYSWAH